MPGETLMHETKEQYPPKYHGFKANPTLGIRFRSPKRQSLVTMQIMVLAPLSDAARGTIYLVETSHHSSPVQ
jgi:hypothetical protein